MLFEDIKILVEIVNAIPFCIRERTKPPILRKLLDTSVCRPIIHPVLECFVNNTPPTHLLLTKSALFVTMFILIDNTVTNKQLKNHYFTTDLQGNLLEHFKGSSLPIFPFASLTKNQSQIKQSHNSQTLTPSASTSPSPFSPASRQP